MCAIDGIECVSFTNQKALLCKSQKVIVLPLYKISVFLKTGGARVFIITSKISIVIYRYKQHSNDLIYSVVVKGEDFVVGGGGSNSCMALFFLNFILFHFLFI